MNSISDRLSAALADRYRIERELGQGGMATVFLAEDLKHKRKVALKVLKPELAAVLGADRFVQEITTTAALQHPHILPLFDSGTADGFLYYVMPFIQGETLRDKLNRETQLGVDESVKIATDVADALHYAHTQGVIHRDIKPENILLANGRPMVADFGIALAVSAAAGGRMTETGLSLGTPHYMSPEQATAEKEISARSDVYSLASVLYEMLAGQPPHSGGSAQQIIMKIITEAAAPVTQLRRTVPPNVTAALAKALEKLPADRFASAREFADALANPRFVTAGGSPLVGMAAARAGLPRSAFVATAGVAVAAVAGMIWALQRPTAIPLAPVVRVPVDLTPGDRLGATAASILAISPQGDHLAYLVQGTAHMRLMIRRTGELGARELVQGASTQPAFSPDGRWLALAQGTKASKVSVEGGSTIPLGDTPGAMRGLAWSGPDTILLGTDRGMFAIPSHGGTPRRVAGVDSTVTALYPVVLADGASVAYTTGPAMAIRRIAVTSLTSHRTTVLETRAAVALGQFEGHLLYVTATGELSAVPYDDEQQRVTGDPVQLESDIRITSAGAATAALSASGSLWYASGQSMGHLVRVTRGGEETRLLDELRAFRHPRFSPDGKRIAVGVTASAGGDIWLYDLANRTFNPLTTDRNDNFAPEWSSNGSRILFRSSRDGRNGVFWQAADGSGQAELLYQPEDEINEVLLSPDEKWLIYRTAPGRNNRDIFSVPLDGDRKAVLLVGGPPQESHARFSPNGKWLVYQSDERGRFEVYVRPFPGPGSRVQISNAGGTEPVWSRSGRRIYYRSLTGGLESAEVTDGATFTVTGRRTEMAPGDYLTDSTHPSWDLWPDESAFMMVRLAGGEARPILVSNWVRVLRERLAAGRP
jgi:Tol biopolymer transport system component/tRNA A-37 threonylcarbamoyl transferase component Bud32